MPNLRDIWTEGDDWARYRRDWLVTLAGAIGAALLVWGLSVIGGG